MGGESGSGSGGEEEGRWVDLDDEVVVGMCWFGGRMSLTDEAYVGGGWGGTLPKASRLDNLRSDMS